MGKHPDDFKVGEAELINDVADRLKVWLTNGISKDEKTDILSLVPRKHKDCNMDAPKLNEEIQANLREEAVRRDKYFYNYQNMIGSSLSLTAMALSMILNDRNEPIDREILLQYLSDAVKIESDLFRFWITMRKVYITPAFDKKIKSALDKTEPTEFLFGNNVKELISGVKSIERVGKDLKLNKKILGHNNSLNWKSSPATEVKQVNQRQRNYFTSRLSNQRNKRTYQQRDFAQTQPLQRRRQKS